MPGNWAGSNRRDSLPIDWPATRKRIFARDGYRCTDTTEGERCAKRASHCDHVIPHYQGGTDDDSNLTSKCPKHHFRKSSQEGAEAMRAQRAKLTRPAPKHPGMR